MDVVQNAENILVVYEGNNSVSTVINEINAICLAKITIKKSSEIANWILTSTYDVIISGFDSDNGLNHDVSLLSTFLRLLIPNGKLLLRQNKTENQPFTLQLKLSGFINVVELKNETNYIQYKCSKPNYEVGSSMKITVEKKNIESTTVWKIDNNFLNDDDNEAIDPDTLLDEDDLKKPDPESLRVCGTTGKRKACKDCSCGLAEELANEGAPKIDANAPKSSCGSCYLGDAFRCATCPYLGMPAFKPGEKIQLAGNQLQPDI